MDDPAATTAPEDLLRQAVTELYAVAPADFISSRKTWVSRARSAGDRELAARIGALRKPSVAAAAMNAVVRAGDPVVAHLRGLGERLRHAQSTLDAAALAGLRGERDAILVAWVEAAGRQAPSGVLTAAVAAEVRDTAIAALADVGAQEVATSGSLTRALSYSGFGEVDVAEAAATTATGVVLTVIAGDREDADAAPSGEDVPEDGAVDAGARDAESVDAGMTDDAGEAEHHSDRVDALARELDEAEKAVAAARADRKVAAEELAAADHARQVATEQMAQAERLLAAARSASSAAEAGYAQADLALATAEEDLAATRQARDVARAALEEAEDG